MMILLHRRANHLPKMGKVTNPEEEEEEEEEETGSQVTFDT